MKWFGKTMMAAVSGGLALSLVIASNMQAEDSKAAPAKEEKKDDESDKRAALVADVGTAVGLSDVGHTNKWPDALVVAGGILMQVDKATGGKFAEAKIEVKDSDGKVVIDDTKSLSFKDQANSLFDDARAMVASDKDRSKALEAQIKEASAPKDRGAIGGPRHISRVVHQGKAQVFEIAFAPNSLAEVSMRGTGGCQFEVIGPRGDLLWHSQGTWGTYHWHTGHGGIKDITVKVINAKGPPVAYTVVTN